MTTYSPELIEEARRRYVRGVFGYVEVARFLGVAPTTVRRWVDSDFLSRNRASSLAAKRRRTGQCDLCGTTTRYSGRDGKRISNRCIACAGRKRGLAERGSGPVQQRIISLLDERGPMRYMTIAREVGISRNQIGPTLDRLMRYGIIRRVGRGVYELTEE